MVTRSLSSDLQQYNIFVVSVHPGNFNLIQPKNKRIKFRILKLSQCAGWVRTDMGGPNAPLSAPESIERMITTLEQITAEKSGTFLSYDGEEIPW